MFLARQEIVQDLLALGVADLLQYHLLGGLGADPAPLHAFNRLLDEFADLHVRVDLVRFVQLVLLGRHFDVLIVYDLPASKKGKLSRRGVNGRANVDILVEALLGR